MHGVGVQLHGVGKELLLFWIVVSGHQLLKQSLLLGGSHVSKQSLEPKVCADTGRILLYLFLSVPMQSVLICSTFLNQQTPTHTSSLHPIDFLRGNNNCTIYNDTHTLLSTRYYSCALRTYVIIRCTLCCANDAHTCNDAHTLLYAITLVALLTHTHKDAPTLLYAISLVVRYIDRTHIR